VWRECEVRERVSFIWFFLSLTVLSHVFRPYYAVPPELREPLNEPHKSQCS
ncbi:Uncharacterized protein DAT39_020154, partial [Clarias magur]